MPQSHNPATVNAALTSPRGTDYRHADEPIGTVEQVYLGDMEQQLAINTYRNIDRLFPTRRIAASSAPYPLKPANTPLGLVTFDVDGTFHELNDFLDLDSVTGLIVLKDGKVAHENYRSGNGPDTCWMSMSVAKSVTSTLIGIAIAEGHISGLDALVTDYVPALAQSAYEDVTIEQVLRMTSGVRWNETFTDANSDRRNLLKAQMAQQPGELMELMASLPRAHEPGAVHTYSTGETSVATEVLIGATGVWPADYLARRIWQPYGMESEARWWLDSPEGHEIGGSGISATLRDFARFGQFFLDEGKIRGQSILPDGWTDRAGKPTALKGGEVAQYGLMWWPGWTQDSINDNAFTAIGVRGQYIYINPTLRIVIAVAGARPGGLDDEPLDAMIAFDAISNALRD